VTFRQGSGAPRPPATLVADLNLLEVAVTAARAAAAVVREKAAGRAALVWQEKSANDFVSEVDLAAEARIREVVGRLLPEATVAGEELSPDALGDRGLIFVADPLDGTTNFLHGYPEYAVSIGVLCDGRLAAGVVHDVVTDEVCTAAEGHGAWLGGERLRVSTIEEPARALIGTGLPFRHAEQIAPYLPQLARVMESTAGVRRAGSAALDLCDVARGRLEAFWELSLMPWDMAAGTLIIREAGGVVTDLAGAPATVGTGGIVAGNPVMHAWLLDQLRAR
jgi:myo-inositol-1(or 4)-monophosphatase